MSVSRVFPNCFRSEGVRFNFGNNREAEQSFHQEHWCNCGYSSPEEMMKDQDMGFDHPEWIRIAKYFLENYHLRLNQGLIESEEEHVRFFLKLLKSSANNVRLSIDLVDRKDGEEYDFIYNGKSDHTPKTNIF